MTAEIDSDIAACTEIPASDPKVFECKKDFFVLETIPIDCSTLPSTILGDLTKNIYQELVIEKELNPALPGTFQVVIKNA